MPRLPEHKKHKSIDEQKHGSLREGGNGRRVSTGGIARCRIHQWRPSASEGACLDRSSCSSNPHSPLPNPQSPIEDEEQRSRALMLEKKMGFGLPVNNQLQPIKAHSSILNCVSIWVYGIWSTCVLIYFAILPLTPFLIFI